MSASVAKLPPFCDALLWEERIAKRGQPGARAGGGRRLTVAARLRRSGGSREGDGGPSRGATHGGAAPSLAGLPSFCDALVSHLTFNHAGVVISIPRSKTDQFGEGQEVSIPRIANPERCPVVALEEWLDVLARLRGSRSGPVFPVLRAAGDKALREVRLVDRRITTNDYRNVLKDLGEDVGLNRREIAGHSLRAGHATQAAENGASPFEIAAQGRWRSLQMVLVYVRMGKRFKNNSANYLGL